jgi:hypothetical protein
MEQIQQSMHGTTLIFTDQHKTLQSAKKLIYYSWIKMKNKLPLKIQCKCTTKRQKRSSSDTYELHILRYVTINPYKVVQ